MKIKISKIDESTFTVREKLDTEYLNELKESLKEDGQWDPILVRPKGDRYELISGHNRFQAVKELGWKEIEATVRDLSDVDAMFLSLKTNLIRQEMTEREQGKVLHKITEAFNISQTELAKKIGKSQAWVNKRIRTALDLTPKVANALDKGLISFSVAEIVGGLDTNLQDLFLEYILSNKITDPEDVRKAKQRFLNNTIYTIGYEGKEIQQFIDILKNNGIEHLVDVRFSAESQYKPDFNKSILARELERAKIKYEHRSELGIPYEWQNPYKDGAVPLECLEKYYKWHTEKEMDFKKFVIEIKDNGKTALMCMEKYAKPTRDQKIHCHRHILANLILETKEFKERIDL
jgi:ParB family chromosome partitioning protein